MAMGRVEFANGVASVYDELGRRRTVKHCDKLIGYGPKGFVIKLIGYGPKGFVIKHNGFYFVHDPQGVIIRQHVVEREFLQEQFNWHNDYLQVRC